MIIIIRSQDRRTITTDLNMVVRTRDVVESVARDTVWDIYNPRLNVVVGTYSTEGKAIKVLDKILDMCSRSAYASTVADRCGGTECSYDVVRVFEVPSDIDVSD